MSFVEFLAFCMAIISMSGPVGFMAIQFLVKHDWILGVGIGIIAIVEIVLISSFFYGRNRSRAHD